MLIAIQWLKLCKERKKEDGKSNNNENKDDIKKS